MLNISSNIMDIPSSSSSTTLITGGRTLDRHNPIITDEKRSGISSKPGTPIGTPLTHHLLQHKPTTPTTLISPNSPAISRKKRNDNKSLLKNTTKITIPEPNSPFDRHSNNNDNDNISPPESSTYLLDDTSFLDVMSGFDPVVKMDPNNGIESGPVDVSGFNEDFLPDINIPPPPPPKPSTESSDQVVVLRVSLHCRGCERKMKKHLSRMSGVTSFNIDFAAKKVTVIGEVTPLQVLANISKVKTAKFWSPSTIQSSSYPIY